ncbi:MAG: transglutaminase-like domain-containing protein, partial [Endozoicomonas sp.]
GRVLLLNILREKQGVCRHKAMVFQLLCHYWGIPARIVKNICHDFVEVSADGSLSWQQYQVGGGGRSECTIREPEWADYNHAGFSELVSANKRTVKNDNSFSQDLERVSETMVKAVSGRQAALLNTTIKDAGKYDSKTNQSQHLYSYIQYLQSSLITQTITKTQLEDLKIRMKIVLDRFDEGNPYAYLPVNCFIWLTPVVYQYIHSDNEWMSIIRRALSHLPWSPITNESRSFWQIIQECFFNTKGSSDVKDIWLAGMSEVAEPYLGPPHMQENYINWFLSLCEENLQLSLKFAGSLQKLSVTHACLPYKERINCLLNNIPYPTFDRVKPLAVITEKEALLTSFASTLPRSKYLSLKIGSNRIDRKYTHAPESYSRLVPERLARGLPAFINESVYKSYKPIIFDMCHIDITLIMKQTDCLPDCMYLDNDKKGRDRLLKAYCEGYYINASVSSPVTNYPDFSNRGKAYFHSSFNQDLFITWICQSQKDCRNTSWRWLFNGYQSCIEQDNGTKLPYGILDTAKFGVRSNMIEYSKK